MTLQTTYDLAAARRELPALKEVTYFNSGTDGIMAEPVRRAYHEKLARLDSFGYYGRREMNDEPARCRALIAALANAKPEEVAVTRNGTDGCSIVLGAFPWKAGDEIVIGDQEHPALLYPSIALQTQGRLKVRVFKFEHDPKKTLANFEALLNERTRVAAFSHVSCETGIRVPAREMIDAAHKRGIRVLLDGAQSLGSFQVDFKALDPDYLTGSAHKWLCGPKVMGILVVREDRLDELTPQYVGGGSFEGWQRFSDIETATATWGKTAAKFEYGMQNPAAYFGLAEAIDYLNKLGWENIEAHEREMSGRLKDRLARIPGVSVQTPRRWEHSSAIVNLAIEGISGTDVSEKLMERKIVQRATWNPDGVRICNGYYTNDEDHDRLIEAVETIKKASAAPSAPGRRTE